LIQEPSSQPFLTPLLEQMCVGKSLETTLKDCVSWLGPQLQCDRVFLYVRSPSSQLGRVPFCWVRHSDFPRVYDPDWKFESPALPERDPMFAAALKAHPSLFIEDIETASPDVVNLDFEHETFNHRALIHAHLCIEHKLWGILQPCVFEHPRTWSPRDRHVIEHTTW
jgi:hypothetical protein